MGQSLCITVDLRGRRPVTGHCMVTSRVDGSTTISCRDTFRFCNCDGRIFCRARIADRDQFQSFRCSNIACQQVTPHVANNVARVGNAHIAALRQAIVSSIGLFRGVNKLRRLLHYLTLVPALSRTALLTYLTRCRDNFLCRGANCVLSAFTNNLNLSSDFFTVYGSRLPGKGSCLSDRDRNFV